jgi:hypothetical protein
MQGGALSMEASAIHDAALDMVDVTCNMLIERCTFLDNHAAAEGGALAVTARSYRPRACSKLQAP